MGDQEVLQIRFPRYIGPEKVNDHSHTQAVIIILSCSISYSLSIDHLSILASQSSWFWCLFVSKGIIILNRDCVCSYPYVYSPHKAAGFGVFLVSKGIF